MWDPVPRPGIESGPFVFGVPSLSLRTTRELPTCSLYVASGFILGFDLEVRETVKKNEAPP